MTFQSGTSGNPKGRLKGSGPRQQVFKDLVLPHKEALIEKGISMAKEGDPHMLRLFLERLLPAKPTTESFEIELNPDYMGKVDYLERYGQELILAVSRGEVSPEEACGLSRLFESQRKLDLIGDLNRRLDVLEEQEKAARHHE